MCRVQIKGLVDQLKVKPLNTADQEKLAGKEESLLAQILIDVLGGEDAPTQVCSLPCLPACLRARLGLAAFTTWKPAVSQLMLHAWERSTSSRACAKLSS